MQLGGHSAFANGCGIGLHDAEHVIDLVGRNTGPDSAAASGLDEVTCKFPSPGPLRAPNCPSSTPFDRLPAPCE